MDLTTTCPTCGHVEDASSSTCSFCGVELALNSDPVSSDDAHSTTADESVTAENQAGELDEELLLQNKPPEKPESVDEAIAHVLSAEGEEEPLELVDAIEIETEGEGEKNPSPQEAAPEAVSETQPAEPEASDAEKSTGEKIVLPEPVQLKAEATSGADGKVAAVSPVVAAAAAGAADKKAQALQKHRAALARAEALKKKKLAIARAIALKKKKAALKQMPAAPAGVRLQKLLKKYVGKTIGINYDNSAKIAPAELVHVNSEYLTVAVQSKELQYHFPLPTILSIIEGAGREGVPTGAGTEVYDAVIKIYPLVLF